MDREKDTILITSDHGNLEDSTTQLHTNNLVPLLTWGYKSEELRSKIESLADVRPAMVDLFVNH
jgi:bisphosphoglycerate-independent phosphoglycerate mutase (AlkP superfamily)